jgi:hypothetical protein
MEEERMKRDKKTYLICKFQITFSFCTEEGERKVKASKKGTGTQKEVKVCIDFHSLRSSFIIL